MTTTLEEIQSEIARIKADCSFENWDSEDGLPPTEAALVMAEKYATLHLDSGFDDIDLGSLRDGGMDVELHSTIAGKNIRVLFEIGPDGTLKGGTARIMDERKRG